MKSINTQVDKVVASKLTSNNKATKHSPAGTADEGISMSTLHRSKFSGEDSHVPSSQLCSIMKSSAKLAERIQELLAPPEPWETLEDEEEEVYDPANMEYTTKKKHQRARSSDNDPIPNDTQLLPGFTSTHAKALSANAETFDEAAEKAVKPPPPTMKYSKKKKGKKSSSKKVVSKKQSKSKKKDTKPRTSKATKIIKPGLTVSGLFGPLQPIRRDLGEVRRRRQRVIAKVLRSTGKSAWEIMYVSGTKEIKKSQHLRIEPNFNFDDHMKKGTKVQSTLDDYPDWHSTRSSAKKKARKAQPTNHQPQDIHQDDDMASVAPREEGEANIQPNRNHHHPIITQYSDDESSCASTSDPPPPLEHRCIDEASSSSESSDDNDDESYGSFGGPGFVGDGTGTGGRQDADNADSTCSDEDEEMQALRRQQEEKRRSGEYDRKRKEAQAYIDSLEGTEFVVKRGNNMYNALRWKVIKQHDPPQQVGVRSKHRLGLRNTTRLQEIQDSSLPLAKLFFLLMFKDADWISALHRMNSKIALHNRIQRATNPSYRDLNPFCPKEFITCHGLIIAASVSLERGENLWPTRDTINNQDDDWNNILPIINFGEHIPLYHFKAFKRFVSKIWESDVLKERGDPWWQFQKAVVDFNWTRRNEILTSTTRVLDESMCAYKPRTSKLGGLPNISYIKRKPEPLGTEFKTSVCPLLKIMTYLEIQRGKEAMKVLPYHQSMGATAACAIRIAENVSQSHLDGRIEVVKGDSWFGSVKAVCGICTGGAASEVLREAVFQVKTNSSGYPKKEIHSILKNCPGGTSVVLETTDPQTKLKLIAVGYKYNSKKVLFFIASERAGSTVNGKPYEMKYQDCYGNIAYRNIPRPEMISQYFEDSNCIDVHNQLRQYSLHLEKKWVTCLPFFRLHTTLIGINVIDTYRLSHFHSILSSHRVTGFRKTFRTGDAMVMNEGGDLTDSTYLNAYTIKSFAGVLAHQLLKYAQIVGTGSVPHNEPLIPTVRILRNENQTRSNRSSTMSDSEEENNANRYQDEDCTDVYEVLDEIFDCNGRLHQAVRIGGNISARTLDVEGTTTATTRPRLCAYKFENTIGGFECTMKRTRVKCLQCNVPYCYPIRITCTTSCSRSASRAAVNRCCFKRHVNNIDKDDCPPQNRFVRVRVDRDI